ncbi:unnamed protein product [Gordionus sp. m RMFG-2023]|uniref:uncharacterized protein LOC135924482 n=1 Tax=Gordionus sp. m RMFG-2023 TaxID=3053472 RepID=UPI0030E5D1A7
MNFINCILVLFNLVCIIYGNQETFIQTGDEIKIIDANKPMFSNPAISKDIPDIMEIFEYNEIYDTLSSSQSYAIPIRFDPIILEFSERPIGMPYTAQVIITNESPNKILQLNSISGNSIHFHPAFLGEKALEPGYNASFLITFLAREIGQVENSLTIHTSLGNFKYQVFGSGVPNAYRIRTFYEGKIPSEAIFAPIISIFNPNTHAIQAVEIWTSNGDFHLELPYGFGHNTEKIWKLSPFQTKPLVISNYLATSQPSNISCYLAIKIEHHANFGSSVNPQNTYNNAENVNNGADRSLFGDNRIEGLNLMPLNANEELLVLYFDIEITQTPGLYSPIDLLDFGTLSTYDLPKTLKLKVYNMGNSPIHITNISLLQPNEALNIDFVSPVKVTPNSKKPTIIATLHYLAFKASNPKHKQGRIQILSNLSTHKLIIPYRANVLRGALIYDHNTTKINVAAPNANAVKSYLSLTNTFDFPLAISDVYLENGESPREDKDDLNPFRVSKISRFPDSYPLVIQPKSKYDRLFIEYRPAKLTPKMRVINEENGKKIVLPYSIGNDFANANPQNSELRHLSTSICIMTNASKFRIPINVYHGGMRISTYGRHSSGVSPNNKASLNFDVFAMGASSFPSLVTKQSLKNTTYTFRLISLFNNHDTQVNVSNRIFLSKIPRNDVKIPNERMVWLMNSLKILPVWVENTLNIDEIIHNGYSPLPILIGTSRVANMSITPSHRNKLLFPVTQDLDSIFPGLADSFYHSNDDHETCSGQNVAAIFEEQIIKNDKKSLNFMELIFDDGNVAKFKEFEIPLKPYYALHMLASLSLPTTPFVDGLFTETTFLKLNCLKIPKIEHSITKEGDNFAKEMLDLGLEVGITLHQGHLGISATGEDDDADLNESLHNLGEGYGTNMLDFGDTISYPSKISKINLHLDNFFDEEVTVTRIAPYLREPFNAFTFLRSLNNKRLKILPKSRNNFVGQITFDPTQACLRNEVYCYTGLNVKDKEYNDWLETFNYPANCIDTDLPVFKQRFAKWKNLVKNKLNKLDSAFIVDTTKTQSALRFYVKNGDLKWPKLISSDRLDFPLTKIGNYSAAVIIIRNPSYSPLLLHIVPISVIKDQGHAILSVVNAEKVSTNEIAREDKSTFIPEVIADNPFELAEINMASTSESQFSGKDSKFSKVPDENSLQLNENSLYLNRFNHTLQVNPSTLAYVLQPFKEAKFFVKFSPQFNRAYSTHLIVRNNLSILETIKIVGRGGLGQLKLLDLSTMQFQSPNIPITFAFTEKHLKYCLKDTPLRSIGSLKRGFLLKNTGQLPVTLKSFFVLRDSPTPAREYFTTNILGFMSRFKEFLLFKQLSIFVKPNHVSVSSDCNRFGFRVHDCQAMEGLVVQPNQSKRIDVSFTPDFSVSKISTSFLILTTDDSQNSPDSTLNEANLMFTLTGSIAVTLAKACSHNIVRPQWEVVLYYCTWVSMAILLIFVVVVTWVEADRLCKFFLLLSHSIRSPNSTQCKKIETVNISSKKCDPKVFKQPRRQTLVDDDRTSVKSKLLQTNPGKCKPTVKSLKENKGPKAKTENASTNGKAYNNTTSDNTSGKASKISSFKEVPRSNASKISDPVLSKSNSILNSVICPPNQNNSLNQSTNQKVGKKKRKSQGNNIYNNEIITASNGDDKFNRLRNDSINKRPLSTSNLAFSSSSLNSALVPTTTNTHILLNKKLLASKKIGPCTNAQQVVPLAKVDLVRKESITDLLTDISERSLTPTNCTYADVINNRMNGNGRSSNSSDSNSRSLTPVWDLPENRVSRSNDDDFSAMSERTAAFHLKSEEKNLENEDYSAFSLFPPPKSSNGRNDLSHLWQDVKSNIDLSMKRVNQTAPFSEIPPIGGKQLTIHPDNSATDNKLFDTKWLDLSTSNQNSLWNNTSSTAYNSRSSYEYPMYPLNKSNQQSGMAQNFPVGNFSVGTFGSFDPEYDDNLWQGGKNGTSGLSRSSSWDSIVGEVQKYQEQQNCIQNNATYTFYSLLKNYLADPGFQEYLRENDMSVPSIHSQTSHSSVPTYDCPYSNSLPYDYKIPSGNKAYDYENDLSRLIIEENSLRQPISDYIDYPSPNYERDILDIQDSFKRMIMTNYNKPTTSLPNKGDDDKKNVRRRCQEWLFSTNAQPFNPNP